jgi:hypothetical protein
MGIYRLYISYPYGQVNQTWQKPCNKEFYMKRTLIVVALIAALIAPIWAQNSGTTPDGIFWNVVPSNAGQVIWIEGYTGTATTLRIPERINNIPVVEIVDGFTGNTRITSVVIPNTVTKIWPQVFMNCVNLTSVTLGTGLTEIGARAFSGCTKLTSITLPASIRAIAGGAFNNCSALTTVNIPDSVRSITFGFDTEGTMSSASRRSDNIFQGATNLNAASRQRLVNLGYTGQF